MILPDTCRAKCRGKVWQPCFPWLFPTNVVNDVGKSGYLEIKVYVVEWGDLIEMNRKRLEYLSESLPVKLEDVGEKFEREYPNLLDEKSRNRLNQRALR